MRTYGRRAGRIDIISFVKTHTRAALISLIVFVSLLYAPAGAFSDVHRAGRFGISAPHFGLVKPGFFRGGKPSLSDIEKLHKLRVKTIVDFTMANRQSERDKARELGMRYINIPWDTDTWLTWFYRYDRVAEDFLNIVKDPANYPVYVHCFHGRDRTGLMIAVYRVEEEGWTYEQALNEMKQYGFDEKTYPNVAAYLKKVADDNPSRQ